ncbi:glycoside hydrolase family 3 N-terminal domain-containing protein [Kribbella hippodromi]|uniref:Glycoside hydrolase family 3 N-terminal domain-containing protein n=1 Tax=Kribbella hippodromi TaxID=434347 RepID=A0ABP4PW23_9ACTN
MTPPPIRVNEAEIRRLALGCVLASWEGPSIPYWIERLLGDGLGGVVLFESNLAADDAYTRAMTDQLRAAAGRPIVIALDEEGGEVTRLPRLPAGNSPGQAALGFLDDVETTEQVYASIGERLVRCGITMNLAPVADVNSNPHNPVIGVRSFGADSELVARHVRAAVRGLQRAGVAACVKHFPGHGDTSLDSHYDLPTIAADLDHLERYELPPFQAGIEAGARAIMTGHLAVPALDAELFTTISPVVNQALLRDRLGFEGTIVSDAMEMRPLSGGLGIVEGTVEALIAGTDTLELGFEEHVDVLKAIPTAVYNAVVLGRLSVERLRDAAARTAALATLDGAHAQPAYDDLVVTAAARSIERSPELRVGKKLLVVECHSPHNLAVGEVEWSLARPLVKRGADVTLIKVDDEATAVAAAHELRASTLSMVVVTRDPHRHPWQQHLLTAAAERTGAVTVETGWPAPGQSATIRTRGISADLLDAAAELLTNS